MPNPRFTDAQIAEAKAEWQGLRDDLSSAEQRIRKIISKKLWLPIGYPTFTAAWKAELADSDFGLRTLRHVVYQMFTEGLTVEEVAAEIDGVGIPTAEQLQADQDAGIPPEQASTRVKGHPRLLRPHTLHIYVGAEAMDEYHRDADTVGLSVLGAALEAIEQRFKEIHEEAAEKTSKEAAATGS
jgi:hypothetical protein